jgi:small conductance mechanosensitive channel
MPDMQRYVDHAVELAMGYGPQVILALLTLIIGLWVIRGLTSVLRKVLSVRHVDATLAPFLNSLVGWSLRILLFISVASMVGIETTSFVAVMGAAGLAVGLALQGSLSNFAGGALILLFRPYKVGDLIEAQGHLGVVQEIQIFTTILLTPNNRRVVVPNGALSNGSIINYSSESWVRVDLVVGISYGSDIDRAKAVLLEAMAAHEKVLTEPAPFVGVLELADSAVSLAVRPHCKPEHFWDVYFGITEVAKKTLDAHSITIPFPQRDVHLYQHGGGAQIS